MKANSLRIGNLVSQNGFYGYVYSIESAEPRNDIRFSDKDIITLFDNGITYVPIDEIEPIPLTEEWLLKFGYVKFELNQIYNEWYLNFDGILKYKIYETENSLKNTSKFIMPNSNKPIKIQYIHQLQNLYFALTGEELKLLENV